MRRVARWVLDRRSFIFRNIIFPRREFLKHWGLRSLHIDKKLFLIIMYLSLKVRIKKNSE